jgi:hypothetical protein
MAAPVKEERMQEELDGYQQELDRCHQVIKESGDFPEKRQAVKEAAVYTARYLGAIYRLEGLYNYRRIETMARKLPEMVRSQLEVADRYRQGSSWRADIALNSLGLDLYIMHSKAYEIAAESAGRRKEKRCSKRQQLFESLLTRVRKMLSMWRGMHRRQDTGAVEGAIAGALQVWEEDTAALLEQNGPQ